MLARRIAAILDGIYIEADSFRHGICIHHEVSHEARHSSLGNTKQVIQHQYLSIYTGPGANANHRHMQTLGHRLTNFIGHTLE